MVQSFLGLGFIGSGSSTSPGRPYLKDGVGTLYLYSPITEDQPQTFSGFVGFIGLQRT